MHNIMKYYCYDCKKLIKLKGKEIVGGKYLKYSDGKKDYFVFKCNECFKEHPELANYQECEIYSRICGYLRPIQQWHASKKEEFRQRKEYKV